MKNNLIFQVLSVALMLLLFGCKTTATNSPLTTNTDVDYVRLKSGYYDIPEASKLRCFWFWQSGVATKKSITHEFKGLRN